METRSSERCQTSSPLFVAPHYLSVLLEATRSTSASASDTSFQELARDLGFLGAYTIGVGTMIGAGIFVLLGIVANNAGPAGMISFLIGGTVSLLTALSLSELATVRKTIDMKDIGGERTMVEALQPLEGEFDDVVVDTAPGWDSLTVNALFYASEVLLNRRP